MIRNTSKLEEQSLRYVSSLQKHILHSLTEPITAGNYVIMAGRKCPSTEYPEHCGKHTRAPQYCMTSGACERRRGDCASGRREHECTSDASFDFKVQAPRPTLTCIQPPSPLLIYFLLINSPCNEYTMQKKKKQKNWGKMCVPYVSKYGKPISVKCSIKCSIN